MSEVRTLSVIGTATAAWRQFAARPDYVLRVAWIPVLTLFAAAITSEAGAAGPPVNAFWRIVFALLNFAILVQALVAWQRYALPHSHPRKGSTGLRAGRAELFSLLHFPLVGVLFAPLLLPALLLGLAGAGDPADAATNIVIAGIGLAVMVFPGGLVLMRAAMMLAAIAEAGPARLSLAATANRVWRASAGNGIRLLLAFYLTILPSALALILLPDFEPAPLQAVLRAILLCLYVMSCGGALAVAWGTFSAAAPARKGTKPDA